MAEGVDGLLMGGGELIVVVGDDVGMRELEGVQRRLLIAPYPGRQGLVGVGLASPGKGFFEKNQAFIVIVGIAWFVVEVPKENAFVVAEGGQDVGYVLP